MFSRSARPAGFTLIELLVVIGIIAILIAILIPVLSKARYRAGEAACVSNLRQVATVLTAYAGENRGWYPKNGAMRNDPFSLKNGNIWDVRTPIQDLLPGGRDIFRCPLVDEDMVNTDTQTSYSLLFDTRGTNKISGSIADGPDRVVQYDVNGNVVADASSSSQMQTWYWVRVDESKLMRRVSDTWTYDSTNWEFDLLAADRMTGRGHPVFSRQTNHPDPTEVWKRTGTFWTGQSQRNPKTSANYAGTDGRVVTHSFPGVQYWPPTPYDDYQQVTGVGFVPLEFRKN